MGEDGLIAYMQRIVADRIKRGYCPLCNTPVDKTEFTDENSLAEFNESGLCKNVKINR